MAQDIAVTGVGAVTAVGDTAEESWEATCRGVTGAGRITRFDPGETTLRSRIACEIDSDFTDHPLVSERETGRYARLATVAGEEAIADAGFEPADPSWNPQRVGTSIASSFGGIAEIEDASGSRPSPRFLLTVLSNLAAGHLSMTFGARGPSYAPATACAAGTHALANGVSAIREGRADVMIAGGTENPISPLGVGGFDVLRALSTRNDDPAAASRPFDAGRDGFVIGEGSGILVLESLTNAESRGADIYATISGYGMTCDAHHVTRPPEDGDGLQRCIDRALVDAGREPDAVNHVNAHATSTPEGDQRESTALNACFDQLPPVTSVKGHVGHTLGAAGALEAVFVAKALQEQTIPPTANYEAPDASCSVPVVTEPRRADFDVAVSTSAGFGGTNGALVLERR